MNVPRTTVPDRTEAAEYFFRYINLVPAGDICAILETQLSDTRTLLQGITEAQSLTRYAPDKWSMRQLVSHVNDTERAFAFRALWFGRGFDFPLPSFDADIAASGAAADARSWQSHIDEFQSVRIATLELFRYFDNDAWMRRGIAGGNPVTVHAIAFIAAGHVAHHTKILQERYFQSATTVGDDSR